MWPNPARSQRRRSLRPRAAGTFGSGLTSGSPPPPGKQRVQAGAGGEQGPGGPWESEWPQCWKGGEKVRSHGGEGAWSSRSPVRRAKLKGQSGGRGAAALGSQSCPLRSHLQRQGHGGKCREGDPGQHLESTPRGPLPETGAREQGSRSPEGRGRAGLT